MVRRRKERDSHTELVGVRFTPEQKALLEEQAEPIPLSTYLRNLAIRRSRSNTLPTINLECYRQIQQLVSAFQQTNQILNLIANQSQPANLEQIQQCYSLLAEIRAELKQIGLTLTAADVEGAINEETDDREFML